MADAKEHFYLNGSVYNNSETDKAVIQIEDTNDILQSNDDWLVHVTRFSCDAMKSLTYVEKDESATWTIRVANNIGEKANLRVCARPGFRDRSGKPRSRTCPLIKRSRS